MKRAFLFLLIISCAGFILAQDIIVTKEGTNIEDVMVISVTADNVIYKKAGTQKTIASSEVDGVLYGDGRYITPPSQQTVQTTENTTTSEDSWSMGDAPQQQSYTEPANNNREVSASVLKEILRNEMKLSSTDAKEEKKRKKEVEKACATEATNAYISHYEEIRVSALQQGYSKMQANKLAKEEAYKKYMQVLEACTNGSSDNSSSKSSNQNSSTSSDGSR